MKKSFEFNVLKVKVIRWEARGGASSTQFEQPFIQLLTTALLAIRLPGTTQAPRKSDRPDRPLAFAIITG